MPKSSAQAFSKSLTSDSHASIAPPRLGRSVGCDKLLGRQDNAVGRDAGHGANSLYEFGTGRSRCGSAIAPPNIARSFQAEWVSASALHLSHHLMRVFEPIEPTGQQRPIDGYFFGTYGVGDIIDKRLGRIKAWRSMCEDAIKRARSIREPPGTVPHRAHNDITQIGDLYAHPAPTAACRIWSGLLFWAIIAAIELPAPAHHVSFPASMACLCCAIESARSFSRALCSISSMRRALSSFSFNESSAAFN